MFGNLAHEDVRAPKEEPPRFRVGATKGIALTRTYWTSALCPSATNPPTVIESQHSQYRFVCADTPSLRSNVRRTKRLAKFGSALREDGGKKYRARRGSPTPLLITLM